MRFGLKDVILLYSGHQHDSAGHVAFFRVVSTRIQTLLQCVEVAPQFKNHVVYG